jgi:protein disulfide-isomerase A6
VYLIEGSIDGYRLESILRKRSLASEKLDEIKIKLNVLKAFTKVPEVQEEEPEKVGREAGEL